MNAVPDCAKQHKDPVLDETVVADEDGNLANVVVYLKGDGIKPQAPISRRSWTRRAASTSHTSWP